MGNKSEKGYIKITLRDKNGKIIIIDNRECPDVLGAKNDLQIVKNFVNTHSDEEILEEFTTTSIFVPLEEDYGVQ